MNTQDLCLTSHKSPCILGIRHIDDSRDESKSLHMVHPPDCTLSEESFYNHKHSKEHTKQANPTVSHVLCCNQCQLRYPRARHASNKDLSRACLLALPHSFQKEHKGTKDPGNSFSYRQNRHRYQSSMLADEGGTKYDAIQSAALWGKRGVHNHLHQSRTHNPEGIVLPW